MVECDRNRSAQVVKQVGKRSNLRCHAGAEQIIERRGLSRRRVRIERRDVELVEIDRDTLESAESAARLAVGVTGQAAVLIPVAELVEIALRKARGRLIGPAS